MSSNSAACGSKGTQLAQLTAGNILHLNSACCWFWPFVTLFATIDESAGNYALQCAELCRQPGSHFMMRWAVVVHDRAPLLVS